MHTVLGCACCGCLDLALTNSCRQVPAGEVLRRSRQAARSRTLSTPGLDTRRCVRIRVTPPPHDCRGIWPARSQTRSVAAIACAGAAGLELLGIICKCVPAPASALIIILHHHYEADNGRDTGCSFVDSSAAQSDHWRCVLFGAGARTEWHRHRNTLDRR